MPEQHPLVVLFDVDNTLLDNDRFGADLSAEIKSLFGDEQAARYRKCYEDIRDKAGFADYLGALQLFRAGLDDDPDLLRMSSFMLEYPFAERVFPGALEAVRWIKAIATPVVLSDGDVVFQPRKVQRAGIWDAMDGNVMIYLHKEQVLDHVQKRYPADHYAMVDDKPGLLAKMKAVMGDKLTTIFVRQGHYAADAAGKAFSPDPDITIERIADLMALDPSAFNKVKAA